MGFPDLPVAQPTAGSVKSLHREGDRRSTAVPCHRNAPPWRRPLTPVNTSILESWVEPATRSHLNEDGTLIKCTACGCARACMPCNHNRSVVCICMSHLVDNSIANVGDFSAVAHTRSAAPCPSLEPGAHSDADAPVLPTPTSLKPCAADAHQRRGAARTSVGMADTLLVPGQTDRLCISQARARARHAGRKRAFVRSTGRCYSHRGPTQEARYTSSACSPRSYPCSRVDVHVSACKYAARTQTLVRKSRQPCIAPAAAVFTAVVDAPYRRRQE